eukprot:7795833-Alexandrium_andersonii.AAC.1
MECCVGLTPDKKAEIALAALARVHMADLAGASGALQLIADYKHAYLLELLAKLVENTPVAATKRLF